MSSKPDAGASDATGRGGATPPRVHAIDVTCPICKASPGDECKDKLSAYAPLPYTHFARKLAADKANDKGTLPL